MDLVSAHNEEDSCRVRDEQAPTVATERKRNSDRPLEESLAAESRKLEPPTRANVTDRDAAKQEVRMKEVDLKLPMFAFIVVTRAALAGGVGLLWSRKLSDSQRRTIGTALVAVGALTTLPALLSVRRGLRKSQSGRNELASSVRQAEELTGTTRYPRSADDEFVSA
jgi:hypothetical protein